MPPNIELYQGREQSFIKHLFLQKYLENAAPKLFLGRSAVLSFVDAFAGPWGNADTQSFSDTSFSLAISTLEGVREFLANRYNKDLKVRFRLCERNRAAVARLEAFAATRSAFDIKVFSGSFEENLPAIRATCSDIQNSFTITFIDPTGWNVDSRPIFEFLKALKGEVLFNFMAEHVNRHAGWDGVQASFGRFLADPDWRPAFDA
ncbi:MAG TPA: three-Cys-motif partner protein TcmP, partial [Paracoccaceae bacterium]|nr:three-Cys-motif partner protein TcmP [Paracoccaceae bacterium]